MKLTFSILLITCACSASGDIKKIEFSDNELPPNLMSMFTGKEVNSVLQYQLPDNYSTAKQYPLVLYIPGGHGKQGGNMKHAMDIANGHECVVATLPLFQADVDKSEAVKGIIVSFSDYPVISSAYKTMLGKLYEAVPNIDHAKSAMVGFSNGAITIAILVSSHDEYILEHFQHYCIVDHGMFHLTDLHKSPTKKKRFLIYVGDKKEMGRALKIRGAALLEDSSKLLGIDLEHRILTDTGHKLTLDCKKDIGTWIFGNQ